MVLSALSSIPGLVQEQATHIQAYAQKTKQKKSPAQNHPPKKKEKDREKRRLNNNNSTSD
jgi:hypothetical protein